MRRSPRTGMLGGLALVAAGLVLVATGKVAVVTAPLPPPAGIQPAPPIPPGALVRFHVIANSDAPSDQAVKLQVRDAVLPHLSAFATSARTPAGTLQAVEAGREEILAAARRALAAAGRPHEAVRLETGTFDFPATRYPGLDLPAGRYPAVRLVLGEGRGHNWWCVMFPMLCYPEWTGQIEAGPPGRAWPAPPGAGSGHSGEAPGAVPARAPARVAAALAAASAGPRPAPAPAGGDGVAGDVVILDERTMDELPVVPRLALLRWLEGLRAAPRSAPPGQIAAAPEGGPSAAPYRP